MKVVCDNCQAVYKIADHKLVKEINRATCKRCGHKIIIFQHNPASARSTLKGNVTPLVDDDVAASASAEDIEKLAQMTNGGLPSLGSLTKELRAISAPPLSAKTGAHSIGPGAESSGLSTSGVPPVGARTLPLGSKIPGLNSSTAGATGSTAPNTVPRNGSGGPAGVGAIPASDSRDTRVYRGPAPSGPVLSAAAAQSAAVPVATDTDPTRPMPYSQATPAPAPAIPPGSPVTAAMGGYASAAPAAEVSHTSVTQVEHQGSALIGATGVLGVVSFVGLLILILLPGDSVFLGGLRAFAGFFLAGFGAAGTMALALVTEKGRWPSKWPAAIALGLAMGLGCGGLALTMHLLESAPGSVVEGVVPPVAPEPSSMVPSFATKSPVQPEALPADGGEGPPAEGAKSAPAAAAPAAAVVEAPKPVAKSSPAPARPKKTSRASTRSSAPPQLPELSDADRAELQSYASSNVSIGSTSRSRSSRSDSSSGRSRRDRNSGRSDKVAKSDFSDSYEGGRTTPGSSKSVAGSSGLGPRGAPRSSSKNSGGKSSARAPNQFIIKTIIGSNKSIKRCISTQRSRDPDLSGKLYVKFKIAPNGSVSRARVTTSRYAGTALDTCISREVNALQFPPFEGPTQKITYPLLVIGD